MNTDKIIRILDSMLEKQLNGISIPFVSSNSIRIKNYVIRKNKKNLYLIFDCKENKSIAVTHFKNCAIAIAKNLANGKDCTYKILNLDQQLLKYYNDAIVYNNFITNAKNSSFREIRKVRLDLALEKTHHIKNELDNLIFTK